MERRSLFKPKASGDGVLSTGDNLQGVGVGVFTTGTAQNCPLKNNINATKPSKSIHPVIWGNCQNV